MSLGFLECRAHDTELLLVYVNFGIRFLPHLCTQEFGQSTVIVLCVRLPGDKNSLLCLPSSYLSILGVRKHFYHCGAMPAMQQHMALPCSKGASCALLFQPKGSQIHRFYLSVSVIVAHMCTIFCELYRCPAVILYML